MAYLLDTDWAIDAFRRPEARSPRLRHIAPSRIGVSRATIAELYDGAFSSVDPQSRLTSIRHFLSPFRIIEIGDPIAEAFAELRAFLRRRGEGLANFDLLIAATALRHDLTLLTFNRRHFARVPGLRLWDGG